MTTLKSNDEIARALFFYGSATVSTAVGVPTPRTGYVVGNGHAAFSSPAFSDVVEWVAANKNRASFLGSWYDGGLIHLDVVSILPELANAIIAGTKFTQEAVYNLGTKETISL